ncbi:hypothetical protein WEI85_44080 [Actinomycetes bacterium KLBMP 9797]
MSALPDLVRDSLADLADTAAVPDGIADRALAAGARRRRRRTVLVAAAAVVVSVAMATPYAVLRADQATPPGAAHVRNAVFALHRGGSGDPNEKPEPNPRWEILDPRTGEYRNVVAGWVSAPTADLRYALVTALFTDPDPRRIGRLDTATGTVRWYTAPAPAVSAPQISPDGRHAAYWMNDSERMEGVAVVDLKTGQVNLIRIQRWPVTLDNAHAGNGWFYPPKEHEWRLDNHRITIHDTVYDLAGKRIGTLPLPADANTIAIRPDGDGALIQPGGKSGAFALTDAAGAVTSQFTLDLPPCPRAAQNCPRQLDFVGWRGTGEMLIWPGPGAYDRPDTPIEAVNLRTGERRTVHQIGGSPSVDGLITFPAERLAHEVRQRIAF